MACAFAGVVAFSRPVSACSCRPFFNDVLAPKVGETNVPRNTLLWLRGRHDSGLDFVFFGEDPEPLPIRSSFIETIDEHVLVLTPEDVLAPQTHYELWRCVGMRCDTRVLAFTTGDDIDVTPPSVPMLMSQSRERSGGAGLICPRTEWVEFDVMHEGLLVVDFDERFDVDFSREEDLGHAYIMTLSSTLQLGEKGCAFGWPGGDEAEVRLGAFDLAGNFSGLGAPDVLEMGCGCRSEGARGPAGLIGCVLLLILGIPGRRRVRERGHRRPVEPRRSSV